MEPAKGDENSEQVNSSEASLPKINQGQASREEAPPLPTLPEPRRPSILQWLNLIVGDSNRWIAIFTLLLLVVTYFQLIASQEATKIATGALKVSEESLRVSQESYQISEQTLKLAERAWVMVKDASIIGPIAEGKIPITKVTFQNNGRSPALKTKMRHGITILHMSNLPDLEMPDIKVDGAESIGVMGPDAITSSEIALSVRLTKEDVLHLKRKEWVIMTYGYITYLDTFDAKHETRFCLLWRNIAGGALSPCDKWNEAN